jgi:tRNA wybutosine-synthesizing protein 3
MARDRFQQRKEEVLSKLDKSSKGSWDKHVLKLCKRINELSDYYTTSSCSGRILIMVDQEKKAKGLFLKVSHELVGNDYLENLKLPKSLVKFKFEPFILHIACRELKDAEKLIKLGQKAGFKKMGLISFGKNFVVEFVGSDKLEFPLAIHKKFLVSKEFIELVLEKSNNNLEKCWEKLERLRKEFK